MKQFKLIVEVGEGRKVPSLCKFRRPNLDSTWHCCMLLEYSFFITANEENKLVQISLLSCRHLSGICCGATTVL